jgi:hypothetical protein
MLPLETGRELWIDAIARTYSLNPELVRRLEEEFRALSSQTLEEFVLVRHRELQKLGLRNEAIYRQLQAECELRRYRSPALSERQVRRIIYG